MANDQTVVTSRFADLNNGISRCMQSLICSREFNGGVQVGPSSCSLKRKRPPKLEIPNVLREICADAKLDCGSTRVARNDAVCFSAPAVGVFSIKGKKTFMEDTHKVVSFPQAKKGFFGVYDGHGGSKAAEYVAQHLDSNIQILLENCSGIEAKEEAVKKGYMKTDQEFLKQGISSGACCVTALIAGKDILVSNLGDCRAVLCRGGMAEALTKDHRAEDEDERRRIQDKGGYMVRHRGAWRIHGTLAVSRSIGDSHLKEWMLAEPDTKTIHLTSDMEYLVLASDGLWEKVSNQEAVNIAMQSCSQRKNQAAALKEKSEEFCCSSPLSKPRRVVMVRCKRAGHSAGSNIAVEMKENEDGLGSAYESPPPPSKARRISETDQTKLEVLSPNKENSDSKALHTSEIDQAKMTLQSPLAKMNLKSPSEENSAFNVLCVSDIAKLKARSPGNFMAKPALSGGLEAACKELADLAVRRGSLDDITVMIIDLNQFKE